MASPHFSGFCFSQLLLTRAVQKLGISRAKEGVGGYYTPVFKWSGCIWCAFGKSLCYGCLPVLFDKFSSEQSVIVVV